jgi:hypothetical protein
MSNAYKFGGLVLFFHEAYGRKAVVGVGDVVQA